MHLPDLSFFQILSAGIYAKCKCKIHKKTDIKEMKGLTMCEMKVLGVQLYVGGDSIN